MTPRRGHGFFVGAIVGVLTSVIAFAATRAVGGAAFTINPQKCRPCESPGHLAANLSGRRGGYTATVQEVPGSKRTVSSVQNGCPFNVPAFLREPDWIPESFATRLDRSEQEDLRGPLSTLGRRALAQVRTLYEEVSGESGAEEGRPLAEMNGEIASTASQAEIDAVLQRLSAEREGLAAPPIEATDELPAERYVRLLIRLGDEYEAELATVLGAVRAREVGAEKNDWVDCAGRL